VPNTIDWAQIKHFVKGIVNMRPCPVQSAGEINSLVLHPHGYADPLRVFLARLKARVEVEEKLYPPDQGSYRVSLRL
jgi:hypothetical protein